MKAPLDRGLFRQRPKKATLSRNLRGGMASRVVGPWEWLFMPALLALALTIVIATPIRIFGLQLPEPVMPLVLAFVWPLIRPSYLAPLVLAGLGLFLDAYWSQAYGFYTLTLMIVYGVLMMVRSFVAGQDWRVVFGIFLITEIVFFGMGVTLIALDTGSVVRLIGVAEQLIATTLFFPIVPYMLDKYVHADVRFG
jgi:rod shape-determining protein MreD